MRTKAKILIRSSKAFQPDNNKAQNGFIIIILLFRCRPKPSFVTPSQDKLKAKNFDGPACI